MNLDLRGKNALVCGSSQGIGKASAIELAMLGANVTLFARNPESLEAVRQSLDTSQGQVHAIALADFTDPHTVKAVAENLCSSNIYHILVNNTGGPPAGPLIDATEASFWAALNNHLMCNHFLVQSLAPGMKSAGYGRIINIISTSVKQPLHNLGVSNTVRGAVANWAKTLAGELAGFGITVNNVLPGATRTARLEGLITRGAAQKGISPDDVEAEMVSEIPAGRVGEAHEIAAAVAFLASPAAAYINGINVPVDGGRTKSL